MDGWMDGWMDAACKVSEELLYHKSICAGDIVNIRLACGLVKTLNSNKKLSMF